MAVFSYCTPKWFLLAFIIHVRFVKSSFHRAQLCPNASWNDVGMTIADVSLIGVKPKAFYIDYHDTIFVTNIQTGEMHLGFNGSFQSSVMIPTNMQASESIFVTTDGRIFADAGAMRNRIDQWSMNGSYTRSWMSDLLCESCTDLYVDHLNNLYCSQWNRHFVLKQSLNEESNHVEIVAGVGCSGSSPYHLNRPHGLFVTEALAVYVVDYMNHRIQLFHPGQLRGITVAGQGSNISFLLRHPREITFDVNDNMFIVDSDNHRIVRSDKDGFRCLVGCSKGEGSALDQFAVPTSMAFDRHGNLYVLDHLNSRIQKFLLRDRPCAGDAETTTESPTPIASATSRSK